MRIKVALLVSMAVIMGIGIYSMCTAASVDPKSKKKIKKRPPLELVEINTEEFPFIDQSINHLYIAPDSSVLNAFFDKWEEIAQTGRGNINIVHIGNSHVQGGRLPHRIRCNLLNYYPDLVGSRGLITPYSACAKNNNPPDYSVKASRMLMMSRNIESSPSYPMGLNGFTCTAKDSPVTIDIKLNECDHDFGTNQIILLGQSPNDVRPVIKVNGKSYEADEESIQFDAIYAYDLPKETDQFQIVLPCTEGEEFSLQGILLASDHPGLTYSSIGVNGASVSSYFKCEYLADDLRLLNPDLVLLTLGTNDAYGSGFNPVYFQSNYERLIDTIRSVNPNCAIVFFTNSDNCRKSKNGYYSNPTGPIAREVFYKLAKKYNGAVWDEFTILGGSGAMEKMVEAGLAAGDRVHFTTQGYHLAADLFCNAFVEAYINHSKQKKRIAEAAIEAQQQSATEQQAKPNTKKQSEPTNRHEGHNYISY